MKLRLTPDAVAAVASALFITGSMRSGTTMMMRLVASLHDVEMFNEPPILYALFPLITEMDAELWNYLFEGTLFEDKLIPALRGKNLNLNRNDDACILQFKTEQDVNARLTNFERRAKVVESVRGKMIAFKLPEMTHLLAKYRSLRPRGRQLVMLREPGAVVASMVARGYFPDHEVLGSPVKWPLHSQMDGNFPFWLPETEHSEWRGMDQIDRCYRAFVHQYGDYVESESDIVVDYDCFVANPHQWFGELTERLGLRTGEFTDRLLASVRGSNNVTPLIQGQADRALASRATDIYRAMREKHRQAASPNT